MKREIKILCDGIAKDGKTMCPLVDTCGFYCPTMDKHKTDHYAWAPYNFNAGHCDEYQERDVDTIIITALNKKGN